MLPKIGLLEQAVLLLLASTTIGYDDWSSSSRSRTPLITEARVHILGGVGGGSYYEINIKAQGMDLAEGICRELCGCFWGNSGEQGYIDMGLTHGFRRIQIPAVGVCFTNHA